MEPLDSVRREDWQKKPSFFSCLGSRDIPSVKHKNGRSAMVALHGVHF